VVAAAWRPPDARLLERPLPCRLAHCRVRGERPGASVQDVADAVKRPLAAHRIEFAPAVPPKRSFR
jgi:hypothetical protein